MKKMIFVWIAISLIFTGCNFQNDVIPEVANKTVNVVVNIDKLGFGDVTRAPRRGWENGDEVVVNLDSPYFCLKLIYNEGRWTTESWCDTEFDGGVFTKEDILEEILEDYLDDDVDEIEVPVMAAYFSSGVKELSYGPVARAVAHGINIITFASDVYYGECIMTCEDGTGLIKRTDAGYELTLDITMKPRVAQFTIRDLELDQINEEQVGEQSFRAITNYGPVNMCSGGTFRSNGISLNNWSDSTFESYGSFAYNNADGVSFYAVPWSSNDDIPEELRSWYEEDYHIDFNASPDFYKTIDYIIEFSLPNGNDWTRNFGPKTVKVGDAVIMDGPYTPGAEGWE